MGSSRFGQQAFKLPCLSLKILLIYFYQYEPFGCGVAMCCAPISLLHSSRASSCEQKLCEPISLLHSSRVSSCEQKLCEPISLLHSSRASSCEQKLREPISLSLERALSSETGSQDPCSARHAVTAWQHFMLLCRIRIRILFDFPKMTEY